ncbi:MAG: tRNA pseudouridine(13) synthase TruD [Granulosicoccaceae bacterium]
MTDPRPSGLIKSAPQDFIVEEILGIDLDKEGEHLMLLIRKCQLNTEDVARELKKLYKAADVDVSYSGLKDKNAITEQWFSVRTPEDDIQLPIAYGSLTEMPEGSWGVVQSHRHSRKLRRGAHQRNRFSIRLSYLQSIDVDSAAEQVADRVQALGKDGFPNYFGMQRFGRAGANLQKAQQYFRNPRRKITRTQKGFCLSAARSALFNRVCAERIREQSYATPQAGEAMVMQGSKSYFVNDGSADVITRCETLDIHPSGPLWGRGSSLCEEPHAAREIAWLAEWNNFMQGLEVAGLKQERRALRAVAHELCCNIEDSNTVLLSFELDKSVYATTLIQELVDTAQIKQEAHNNG